MTRSSKSLNGMPPHQLPRCPHQLLLSSKTYGSNAFALTEQAVKALDKRNVRYVIESFDPRVLLWLRVHRPRHYPWASCRRIFFKTTRPKTNPYFYAGVLQLCWATRSEDPTLYHIDLKIDTMPPLQIVCSKLGVRLVTWTHSQ